MNCGRVCTSFLCAQVGCLFGSPPTVKWEIKSGLPIPPTDWKPAAGQTVAFKPLTEDDIRRIVREEIAREFVKEKARRHLATAPTLGELEERFRGMPEVSGKVIAKGGK